MNKSDIRSLICTTFSDLKNNINRGAKVVNCLDAKNHMCPFSENGGMIRACEKEIAVAEKDLLEKLEAAYDECPRIECDGLKDLRRQVDRFMEGARPCPGEPRPSVSITRNDLSIVKETDELRDRNYTILSGVLVKPSSQEDLSIRNAFVEVRGQLSNATLHKGGIVEVYSGGRADSMTLNHSSAVLAYDDAPGDGININWGQVSATSNRAVLTDVHVGEGKLTACNYAVIRHAYILDGGSAYINRAILNSAVVKSGGILTANSARLSHVTVKSGGDVRLTSSYLEEIGMSGGRLNIASSTISGCYVSGGAYVSSVSPSVVISSASVSSAHIHLERGTINKFTVYMDGDVFVSSGSVTNGSIQSHGHVRALGPCDVSDILVDGGKMEIMGGMGGSFMRSKAGPAASRVTVMSLGQFVVGTSATLRKATVIGGTLYVWANGKVSDLVIGSKGTVIVSSGGLVENCSVDSGGELFVLDGGHAEMDLNGGTVRGNMHGAICQMSYKPGDDKNG